jgi:hypothetical protein
MDQRELILSLEKPFSEYSDEPAKVREIIVAGLSWPMPYWPELAVRWIEDGAPIDPDIRELLEKIENTLRFPQNLRHRARVACRRLPPGDANA